LGKPSKPPGLPIAHEELMSILKPNGKVFIVEPMFHVSKKDFEKTKESSIKVGFLVIG
jgi:hypothetical protein